MPKVFKYYFIVYSILFWWKPENIESSIPFFTQIQMEKTCIRSHDHELILRHCTTAPRSDSVVSFFRMLRTRYGIYDDLMRGVCCMRITIWWWRSRIYIHRTWGKRRLAWWERFTHLRINHNDFLVCCPS